MIRTIELIPGVTLRCFPDSRFRQGFLSLQMIRPLNREENALNALLPTVLLRGCVCTPDLRAVTQRLDDLYGAAVGATVRRVGDYHSTGLSANFIDDRYVLDGDGILMPMLDFVGELLLDPLLENGAFCPDYVESEKKNLICAIEASLNDKRQYASNQWAKRMYSQDPNGIARLGEPEQIEEITPERLYSHYKKLLRISRIDIFYTGSAQPERIAEKLRPLFSALEREYAPLPAQTAFRDGGVADETERMAVTQGRLCMGFVTPVTIRDPGFAAMQVCNAVFGGSMISKLFMVLREKMSLCYDIGSSYQGTKGVISVTAGIDGEMDKKVREEILAQLEDCRQGRISDGELQAAKASIISSLRGTHDSGGSIEAYYATAALNGLKMTPAEYMQAVEAVTAEEVAAAARSIRPHTVYFLKGDH